MGIVSKWLMARCEMCGERKSDVGRRPGTQLKLCTKCNKVRKSSDRSKPYGATAAGYKSGQPPKIAGPMGGRYTGPAPQPQRRR